MSRLKERIENFNKAFDIYSDAVKEFDEKKVLTHMALVQAYEICFELAWKCLKDYLQQKGIDVNYPTEVIKEAFNKNTLKNGQLWIDMLQKDQKGTPSSSHLISIIVLNASNCFFSSSVIILYLPFYKHLVKPNLHNTRYFLHQ